MLRQCKVTVPENSTALGEGFHLGFLVYCRSMGSTEPSIYKIGSLTRLIGLVVIMAIVLLNFYMIHS